MLYWKYLHCSGFLSNLRLPWKTEFSMKIFTVLNIFLTIQDFWATLRLPWKPEFGLKFFIVFNIIFTFRIFDQLALALNSLYWIHIFTVTCGEVRDWGAGMWKRLFRQPLPLPHLSLPLPLTKNEKTTVDLSSTNFAVDASYASSRSLVLLISYVHSD